MLALSACSLAGCLASWFRIPLIPLSNEAKDLPSVRVTFYSPAKPASKLIPELGANAHVRLECSTELSNEVLLLNVKSRPLSEVMQKLAESDSAEWVPAESGYRFVRTNAVVSELHRKEIETVASGLRKRLAPIFDGLKSPLDETTARTVVLERRRMRSRRPSGIEWKDVPIWEVYELKLRKLDSMNPIYRLVGRCLEAVGLDAIAGLRTGERAVFSNRPNPAQKPMGPKAATAMELFIREDATWKKMGQSGEDEDRFGDNCFVWRGPWFHHGAVDSAKPIRVIFAVSGGWWGSFSFKLLLLDSNSHALLDLSSDELLRWNEPHITWRPDRPGQRKQMIMPSSKTKLIVTANSNTQPHDDKPNQPAPSHAVIDWLSHPETNEPLSLLPTDGFVSAANESNVNLAACLSDELALIQDNRSNLDLARFLDEATTTCDMEFSTKGGWMVARPRRPLRASALRVDRRALGEFLRIIAKKGAADVFAQAEYISHTAEDNDNRMATYAGWILGRGRYPFMGSGNPELLTMFGVLSASQNKRLFEGATVKYGELSSEQMMQAKRIVYGPHSNYSGGGRAAPGKLGDLESEPTEMAQNGIDLGTGVRAKKLRHRWVCLIDPAEKGRQQTYTVIHADEPFSGTYSGPGPRVPKGGFDSLKYQIRMVNGLHVEADICAWRWIGYDFFDEPEAATEPPKALDQMAEDLRKRVKQYLEKYKSIALPNRK